MSDVVDLAEIHRSQGKARKRKAPLKKPGKLARRAKKRQWDSHLTAPLDMFGVAEMMSAPRDSPGPASDAPAPTLESGVLAFRRESNGDPRILLISRKRSKKWGIPKGRVVPHLSLRENAAKEAFEEAGVVGQVSPFSVGMFRAKKRTEASRQDPEIMEVWVYLLEVAETLSDWPEKGRRTTRWVSCEDAARRLREPMLAHLCLRLAQR